MKFSDTQVLVKNTLARLRGGTASDVHEAIASKRIDAPSVRTVERHLMHFRRLGVVETEAALREERPVKIWKVASCLQMSRSDAGDA